MLHLFNGESRYDARFIFSDYLVAAESFILRSLALHNFNTGHRDRAFIARVWRHFACETNGCDRRGSAESDE